MWLYVTGPIVGVAALGLIIYLIIAKIKASAITSVAAKGVSGSSVTSAPKPAKSSIMDSESVRLQPEKPKPELKEGLKVVEEVEDVKEVI